MKTETTKPETQTHPETEMKKTTICGPRQLIEEAQEKAKRENRNFSQYCRNLIQQDLQKAS